MDEKAFQEDRADKQAENLICNGICHEFHSDNFTLGTDNLAGRISE